MQKIARISILTACGFLILTFFAPLWHIKLDAPQYPGGLDMYIWINKITGTDEFTLQNINILNHYIGMQPIQPDSFKELEIMPFALIFLILTGIISSILNKKSAYLAWFSLLIVGGIAGMTDFYLWQQAFGNNLDPLAPIKVEGMSYSPPFIGSKTLLNIKASSYPHLGGIFFGLALLAASFGLYLRLKSKTWKISANLAIVLLLLLIFSCRPESQPISYGFDSCDHCRMTIADERYGSELVTKKGKVYKFDAIECMVDFIKADDPDREYALYLVTDITTPGAFIPAENAWYLRSRALPSPMGMYLNAFEHESDVKNFQQRHDGEILKWREVRDLSINNNIE